MPDEDNPPSGILSAALKAGALGAPSPTAAEGGDLQDYSRSLGLADLRTKRPWIDVRAFGATGNGSSDDTSAVHAAIEEAKASGAAVYFPSGTYLMRQPIYLVTGIRLIGANQLTSIILNRSTDIIVPNKDEKAIWYAGVQDISLRGGLSANSQTGIDANKFRNCVFRDVIVENTRRGIYLRRTDPAFPCYYNMFDNVTTLNTQIGLDFDSANTANNNKFNSYHDHGVTGSFAGRSVVSPWSSGRTCIKLAGTGNEFTGTRIGGYSGSMDYGLYIQSKASNNIFVGLYIEAAPRVGIYSEDLGSRTNFIFGVHFDGIPERKIEDARSQNTFIGSDLVQLAGPIQSGDNQIQPSLRIAAAPGWAGSSARVWELVGGQGKAPASNPVGAGSFAIRNHTSDTIPFEVLKDGIDAALKIGASGVIIGPSGAPIRRHLSATTTWNPPQIPDEGVAAISVAVPGAAVGDTCTASVTSAGSNNVLLSAHVSGPDTVRVVMVNKTGGGLDLSSGTVRADVWKH